MAAIALPRWYWRWRAWRLQGGKGTRPTRVPRIIPRWAHKRLAEIARRRRPPVQPHRARSGLENSATNLLFCAQEPALALSADPKFAIVLSADRAYVDAAEYARVVNKARDRGQRVLSWSDCWATSAWVAIELARILELDGWVGQAERAMELRHAVGIDYDGRLMTIAEMHDAFGHTERAKIIVGNPNDWTPAQRVTATEMIEAGDLALVNEVYANVLHPFPNEYGTQGVPVASHCIGLYDGKTDHADARGYVWADEYRAKTPPEEWRRISAYHAAGPNAAGKSSVSELQRLSA